MHLRHRLVGLLLLCSSPGFAQNATLCPPEKEEAKAPVPASAQDEKAGQEPAKQQTKPPSDGRPKPTESATPP